MLWLAGHFLANALKIARAKSGWPAHRLTTRAGQPMSSVVSDSGRKSIHFKNHMQHFVVGTSCILPLKTLNSVMDAVNPNPVTHNNKQHGRWARWRRWRIGSYPPGKGPHGRQDRECQGARVTGGKLQAGHKGDGRRATRCCVSKYAGHCCLGVLLNWHTLNMSQCASSVVLCVFRGSVPSGHKKEEKKRKEKVDSTSGVAELGLRI